MARTEYTTRKRVMMQVVVWLVFVASVAVAAGVVQWKTGESRVDLGPAVTLVGMKLRLPHGWLVESGTRQGVPFVFCAEQVKGNGIGRRLIIHHERAALDADPLEVLASATLSGDGADQADQDDVETFSVDGARGVVLPYTHAMQTRRGVVKSERVAACIVLPGGNAVVVQYLDGDTGFGRHLVRQIAESVRMGAGSERVLPALPSDGDI